MDITNVVDLRGLSCPIYVLKCKVELNRLGIGETINVIASDHACVEALPKLAKRSGCQVLRQGQQHGTYSFQISKTANG